MNNTIKYVILFLFGVFLTILEFLILKFDNSIGIFIAVAGIVLTIAGGIGACISSKKIRSFFLDVLKIIFDYF